VGVKREVSSRRIQVEEYFNARPLVARLYDDIRAQQAQAQDKDKDAWIALKQKLVGIAKDTTSRQVMRLVRAGHLTTDIVVPMAVANATQPPVSKRIALYQTHGLRGLNDTFVPSLDDSGAAYRGTTREGTPATRYSITIRVKEVFESGAQVSVLLYRDVFENGEFKPSQSLADLRPIEFEVSYFSTPYMDNTRLFDRSRFSVIFDGCRDLEAKDGECRFPPPQSARLQAQFQVSPRGPLEGAGRAPRGGLRSRRPSRAPRRTHGAPPADLLVPVPRPGVHVGRADRCPPCEPPFWVRQLRSGPCVPGPASAIGALSTLATLISTVSGALDSDPSLTTSSRVSVAPPVGTVGAVNVGLSGFERFRETEGPAT
jgi:hypothetical protein